MYPQSLRLRAQKLLKAFSKQSQTRVEQERLCWRLCCASVTRLRLQQQQPSRRASLMLEVEEEARVLSSSVKGDRPKRLVPLGLLCAYAFQAHHRHHQQQKQRVTTCPSASTFFFSGSSVAFAVRGCWQFTEAATLDHRCFRPVQNVPINMSRQYRPLPHVVVYALELRNQR